MRMTEADVYLVVGVILCSFDHWGAGMILIGMAATSAVLEVVF
jgi:hypothetical protein